MSTRPDAAAGTPSCRHNYHIHGVVPLDLEDVKSVIKDAHKEFCTMMGYLEIYHRLTPEPPQPTKKRKAEHDQEQVPIDQQVESAIHKIMQTKEWSGKREVQGLLDAHTVEYQRKWAHPDGVYHDLLRVYPELRVDIFCDRHVHEEILQDSALLKSVMAHLRLEGRRLARLQTFRTMADNKPKAKKAKK